MPEEFDYVIVGAGSAGSVLAWRLSEDPKCRVLVVEGGSGDGKKLMNTMPAGAGKVTGDPRHMLFYPVVNPHTNAVQTWVRGQGLGGSSSVNGMIWVRGHPEDYDGWEAAGATGWGSREMAAAFSELELPASQWNFTNRALPGRLPVGRCEERFPLADAWIDAVMNLGVPRGDGLVRGNREGVDYSVFNIRNGERWSSARAFLHPAMRRKNVRVVRGFKASKVLIEGRRAVGVEGFVGDAVARYTARREVILSANAFNSPKLLMLSGIGPAEHLRRHGISVLVDSPDVGTNMQDHAPFVMQFRMSQPGGFNREVQGWRLPLNALRYVLSRSGPLAVSPFPTGAALRTSTEDPRPDAFVFLAPFSLRLDKMPPPLEKEPGFMIGGYALRPRSRGTVRLKSPDARELAEVSPNTLVDEYDLATSVRIFHKLRQIAGAPPLRGLVERELFPGPDLTDDAEAGQWIRRTIGGGGHTVGTCRMGGDERSVLDPRLRVRGVDGLRVIDCSSMPRITSANTNGPVTALAWRGAALVLQDGKA